MGKEQPKAYEYCDTAVRSYVKSFGMDCDVFLALLPEQYREKVAAYNDELQKKTDEMCQMLGRMTLNELAENGITISTYQDPHKENMTRIECDAHAFYPELYDTLKSLLIEGLAVARIQKPERNVDLALERIINREKSITLTADGKNKQI